MHESKSEILNWTPTERRRRVLIKTNWTDEVQTVITQRILEETE